MGEARDRERPRQRSSPHDSKESRERERPRQRSSQQADSKEPRERERPRQRSSLLDSKFAMVGLFVMTGLNLWRYFFRAVPPAPAPEVEVGGHQLDLSGDLDDD
eukprot:TRINITY_DN2653_c0_g1_i1.p2 TRINITY_DN2653_c0_g1~~TRINITY_DN2653_c0_g1_i1.p2  ORF type:complete len:104 (-),score=20.10 TRINITY_DN2653_c0_g1_i1:31-342(-)